MGSRFEITVVSENKNFAEKMNDLAVKEISRIENLISSWDSNSQTSMINRNSGIKPVVVKQELFDLIVRSIKISKLTDGAFDITYASMDKIWKFDGSMKVMPDEAAIEESVRRVGYKNIVLDPVRKSVFLKKKGMKIGFGAIGKGYAADRAKELLIQNGVQSGIINAGGDLVAWGSQPDGSKWKIGITNPIHKRSAIGQISIHDNAIVTSGNYEKYVQIDGVRYSHIINPKTGYPSKGIRSVTISAPKAEIADALATSVFVMGIDIGLNQINQMPHIECLIIDDSGQLHQSKHLRILK